MRSDSSASTKLRGWNFLVANRDGAIENHNSDGVLAQLVEHHNGIVGVRGSNPLGSRNSLGAQRRARGCQANCRE